MKRITLMSGILPLVIIASLSIFYIGCEEEPSIDNLDEWFENNPHVSDPRDTGKPLLSIDPITAEISERGEAVSFRVRGGNESTYQWAVADTSRGSITWESGTSDTALFTAARVLENSVIVYDSDGRSAVASITEGSTEDVLSITPDAVSIATNTPINGTVQFIVTGGTPTYNWNSTQGSIGASGSPITWTNWAVGAGTITISVNDADGKVATATITKVN